MIFLPACCAFAHAGQGDPLTRFEVCRIGYYILLAEHFVKFEVCRIGDYIFSVHTGYFLCFIYYTALKGPSKIKYYKY